MATKDDKQQLVMTPDEVRNTINNSQQSMAGYQPVTPVDVSGTVPQSAAWRNVQMTGNAKTDYKGILGAQPQAYQGQYATQMNQTLNNLLGQKPFNYDVNTDALYQQIKDNYIKQGKQAMMDTQGMSAALTGGYGNSYGAMAGQQAYQESLGNLSAQIPELYQLAYNRYLGDENSQRQNLAALQGLDESDYQRYQYDTQQYENKLADLYKKYKASLGGGAKKKDPRSDAEWFMTLGDNTNYDVDQSIDAVAGQMGWTPQYTDAVRTITHNYTETQAQELRKQKAADFLDTVNSWFNGKKQ